MPEKSKEKEKEKLRLDKYLWSIRLFKTRTEAADACTRGKVKYNGDAAKASKAAALAALILDIDVGIVIVEPHRLPLCRCPCRQNAPQRRWLQSHD